MKLASTCLKMVFVTPPNSKLVSPLRKSNFQNVSPPTTANNAILSAYSKKKSTFKFVYRTVTGKFKALLFVTSYWNDLTLFRHLEIKTQFEHMCADYIFFNLWENE